MCFATPAYLSESVYRSVGSKKLKKIAETSNMIFISDSTIRPGQSQPTASVTFLNLIFFLVFPNFPENSSLDFLYT